MKRITIVSVLALFTALAATGCLAPSGSTETDEGNQTSGVDPNLALDGEEGVDGSREAFQVIELGVHPADDRQGPHPEPWQHRAGPHPEPWQGKLQGGEPSTEPTDPADPSPKP